MTTSPSSRECGTCQACCTAEGVHELRKPPGEPCQFLCEKGCAAYETRPESCRRFRCLWLQGVFEDGARPDGLGVVFSMTPAPITVHPWRRYILAMEVVTGAASRAACADLIRWLTEKGEIVWVYGPETSATGAGARIHYPDGTSNAIDPGLTFDLQMAQIEMVQQGATQRDALARFPAIPSPPPRAAKDWMRDRAARRVIERGKPVAAVQRVFEIACRENP